jgi:drug/metabolite transporter (DMT)-like permease
VSSPRRCDDVPAHTDLSADALLLITLGVWSFNFTAIRYTVSNGVSPLSYAELRWLIVAVLLCVVTRLWEGSLRMPRRDLLVVAGLATVGVWANQIAFAYSAHYASAATIALIFGTLPVFVAVLSRIAGIEQLHARHWIAVGVSLAGVALVAAGSESGLSAHVAGVLLGVVSVASWAFFTVGAVPLMRRHSPLKINAVAALIAAAGLTISSSWQLPHQDWDGVPWLAWGGLLYGALGSVGIGNVLFMKATGRVGPGRAALYVNLQPFLGAVFAVIALDEALTTVQIAGGAVVAAGILIARMRKPRAPLGE